MQEILLVNPARRPSKRRKSTKAASPAQKRARAAFAAMARARAKTKRKASPKRRSVVTVSSNPSPRRRHKRVRRNPARAIGGRALSKPMAMLTPALIGALGATAVNTILAKIPLPAAANTGRMRYITQAGAAIALSMIASKMGMKGSTAAQMAEGSLTVTLHQAITDVAAGMGMNLSGMGYYLPGVGVRNAMPSRSANPSQMAMNGVGEYLTGPGASRMAGITQQTRKTSGFAF